MESAEIRRRWLAFFEARGHTVVPSASLVADDPTLLLVNAGMVPFKPYFLGAVTPAYPRATSVQKCVRTLDIDEVGKTTRHASFFQMCGNFSFGDYFKEKAIPYAWELLTTPVAGGGYGLDAERLWVTVYLDDDEAARLWSETVGVPAERIQRRGMDDNFWSMGVPGPCGPCSEIYYDRGPEHGRDGGPIVDEERYLEVWNLVFMQYVRGASTGPGKSDYPILGDLPAPSIDTGLGLERLATLLQGVENVYEIDTTRRVLDRAATLSGRRYGAGGPDGHRDDVRLRVVADHARTAVMLIGDGVVPANEGRGYVLRRMVRRVVRSMRLLGAGDQTMAALVQASIEAMGPQYPELVDDRSRIEAVAVAEETAFLATLGKGTLIFDQAVAWTRQAGVGALSGDQAFALHDTYGFPIDLTLEMAAEAGLAVDEEGFRRLMGEQRSRAKADASAKKSGHADLSAYRALGDRLGADVVFTGYDEVSTEARLTGILLDGHRVEEASEGTEVEVVLDRTPFYAEAGGQLADTGRILLDDGTVLEVLDVQKPDGTLVVHRARVRSGLVHPGVPVLAEVDVSRRRAISRAHTATHLVHRAIRDALGETATQAGSENAPGRFRFDFSATGPVPASVLADVEATVNAVLADDLPVSAEWMSQEQARATGAMALFGEKYGPRVRVVSVGEWARELCGGTHAQHSAQIGVVTLLGESSIGTGIRRVEALVGADAYRFLAREHVLVAQLSELLKVRPDEVADRVAGVLARLREAEKQIERAQRDAVLAGAGDLVEAARDVHGVTVVVHRAAEGAGADDLRSLALQVRGRLPGDRPGVVVVGAVADGRPLVVVAVN
ncbi:MAG: alanine--tRNA ligase, partial [Actinomycetes bacterium]